MPHVRETSLVYSNRLTETDYSARLKLTQFQKQTDSKLTESDCVCVIVSCLETPSYPDF